MSPAFAEYQCWHFVPRTAIKRARSSMTLKAACDLIFRCSLVTDGKPLWDGEFRHSGAEANAAQHAEWEQSRDQAIINGEIDLGCRK